MGIQTYCFVAIGRNLQLLCQQYLRETLRQNQAKISKRRRAAILSNLVFSVDGTIRDFSAEILPQTTTPPPPPPQTQWSSHDSQDLTHQAIDSQDLQSTQYIDPFRRASGGFQLFERRRSTQTKQSQEKKRQNNHRTN